MGWNNPPDIENVHTYLLAQGFVRRPELARYDKAVWGVYVTDATLESYSFSDIRAFVQTMKERQREKYK